MAYVKTLFDTNFLEYASYVIKDRAIPHLNDGLKPVQRRILHSLLEMDDGKFHKVANVVGHCMKYHPHGDASIYSALVVLANKELFIDRQGNFGNIFTGDEASAARYIECRILPLAKKILYNPEITRYEDSYDGRNKEPVTFPAKVPLVLVMGAEGIAVGMSTKILPHNFVEVLEAVKGGLRGKKTLLYPDFLTGGEVDVSDYQDGMGKVLVRAKLDVSDPKRILITELPFGSTTESLITSIENAAKKNKIKIAGINDFTTDKVEIEIKLQRGTYTTEVVDALYAFTDCEMSISVNSLIIVEKNPRLMTVSEIIAHHSQRLLKILSAELKIEEGKLKDRHHARTLEQIFIQERIYKKIEDKKTQAGVVKAVLDGLKPFANVIKREVIEEDVERLLKIPIRRISLYDINRARTELEEIEARLKEVRRHLKNIIEYAEGFLDEVIRDYGAQFQRKTVITSFEKIDAREAAAAQRNLDLRYDEETGYIGTGVNTGRLLFKVSSYDRILVIRRTGAYSVIDVPDRLFVDKGMYHCVMADKDEMARTVISAVYKNKTTGHPYIKRCIIDKFIIGKGYTLVGDEFQMLCLTAQKDGFVRVQYLPKPRVKMTEQYFKISSYLVKGIKAGGVRLSTREAKDAGIVDREKKTENTTAPAGKTAVKNVSLKKKPVKKKKFVKKSAGNKKAAVSKKQPAKKSGLLQKMTKKRKKQ
ncbi:MAG: DNA topoisomerase IV subunit A [Spirochaetales bacterium]|nr:DNA topoisomerase IV subunit A [Spirochaetales bacterium]